MLNQVLACRHRYWKSIKAKRVADGADEDLNHFCDFLGHLEKSSRWTSLRNQADRQRHIDAVVRSLIAPLVLAGRDVFGVSRFLSMLSLPHTPFCHDRPLFNRQTIAGVKKRAPVFRKPLILVHGAGGRNRTDTWFPKPDFESGASTSFATPAEAGHYSGSLPAILSVVTSLMTHARFAE